MGADPFLHNLENVHGGRDQPVVEVALIEEEGLDVTEFDGEDVFLFLNLSVELAIVLAGIVSAEVVEEVLEEVLQVGVGAVIIRVALSQVLVEEGDSLTVHLIITSADFSQSLNYGSFYIFIPPPK